MTIRIDRTIYKVGWGRRSAFAIALLALLGAASGAWAQAAVAPTGQELQDRLLGQAPAEDGARGFSLFSASAPHTAVRHHPTVNRGSPAAARCAVSEANDARALNLCVTFALNSTALTDRSRQNLDTLVSALNSPRILNRDVAIEGYTDVSGAAAANLKLSDGRANAVADYLAGHGVARNRIDAKGLGATNFLSSRAAADPANRRVEARLKD